MIKVLKFLIKLMYILLPIASIVGIINLFYHKYQCFIACLLLWIPLIVIKVSREKNNQFKDWELRTYGYNATSNKEQKEHKEEYKKK